MKIRTSITIEEKILEAVTTEAGKQSRSVSQMIEILCKEGLKK